MDVKLMADAVRTLFAPPTCLRCSPAFMTNSGVPLLGCIGCMRRCSARQLPAVARFLDPECRSPQGRGGWRPHRDKGRRALFDDGSPKSLTTWIPLSHATPLNGCLYVVPAPLDPTYATADETEMKFDYQSIRALPAAPGDFVIWNQALFHWGSRSSLEAEESRVSVAFQLQRADVPAFDSPLIDPLAVPPFEARLRLIARQLYRYRHMYELDPELARMASESYPEAVPCVASDGAAVLAARPAGRAADDPSGWGRVGRNEPCRCGSGKRYKHCHGVLA